MRTRSRPSSAALADLRRYVTDLDGTTEPRLTLIPRWAEACGLVRILKGAHVPVKKNAKLLKQPLELWARAFATLGEAGYGLLLYGLADQMPALAVGLEIRENSR
ncbi:hypothetical protein [Amycolatopsis sp. NPDC003731]